jgi:hypothetical protein
VGEVKAKPFVFCIFFSKSGQRGVWSMGKNRRAKNKKREKYQLAPFSTLFEKQQRKLTYSAT